MFEDFKLQRPLAIVDLETTGVNLMSDRIVEISVLKIFPDGRTDHRTRRVNPGIPIPPEATEVHGISDADVADEPLFGNLASKLLAFLDNCDLCGFNIKRFDLRLLHREFSRSGLDFPLADRAVVDVLEIYHARERRDLSAAVRFYCGREHGDAHGAGSDALATAEVLVAQVAHYADLPKTIGELHKSLRDPDSIDLDQCFKEVEGQVVFGFGKYKGRKLGEIAVERPDYLHWMLGQDFYDDAKSIVRDALAQVGSSRAYGSRDAPSSSRIRPDMKQTAGGPEPALAEAATGVRLNAP